MQLFNEWYYFDNAIIDEVCDQLIHAGEYEFKKAEIQSGEDDGSRRSDIKFINEQWLVDLIWPFMLDANKNSKWCFDVESVEDMQITKYKKCDYYSWHFDGLSDSSGIYTDKDQKFLYGNVRKLSMTILLNDDFEGGELQIASYNKGECFIKTPKMNKGSVIVFHSFIEHQVLEVTEGERYSLVAWFLGKPFK